MEGTPIYEKLIAGPSDDWDMPVADDKQILGGVKVFDTIAQRDAWAAKYPSRLPDTVALVGNGENKYPSWYKWETTWHFSGYFGGLVIADMDGALTRVDSTAVLGPDFKLQAAGDQGNGVLIMLSDAAKASMGKGTSGISGIEITQDWGDYGHVYPDISHIHTRFPVEAVKVGKDPKTTRVAFGIKPGVFESHHDEARLAYFGVDEIILGATVSDKRRGALWADNVSYGGNNVDLTADRTLKAVHLQDPYDDDPSVTGGAAMLCALHLAFYGKATYDGTIEVYRINEMTGDILLNSSGQPMGVIHHYKAGDLITPITIGELYIAKGIVNAVWCVNHTFTDEPIRMEDWDVGSSCMLDTYVEKESVNPALNEFQMLIEKSIRVQKKYYGADAFSSAYAYKFDVAQEVVDVGQAQDSVIGIDFENTTKLKAAMSGSVMNIKDDNGSPAYFNTGIELSNEDTINLRGKEVSVSLEAFTRYGALNLFMFVYTGNMADVPHPIVTGVANMQPTLSAGWDAHDHGYLSEHPEGEFHPLTKNFAIPNDAGIVMFGVVPVEETAPTDFSLKPMSINVVNPFTAYELKFPKSGKELSWDLVTTEFITNNNKLWGISATKTNLPFGEKVSGTNKAPVELDVTNDDGSAYDGGIKLTSATEYSIEVWLNVRNYFKEPLTQDETIKFWVESPSGKISESAPLIVKNGDNVAHVVNWKFNYDNQTAGTVLKLYGQSSSKKVMFLSSGPDNAAGVIVTAKVSPQI